MWYLILVLFATACAWFITQLLRANRTPDHIEIIYVKGLPEMDKGANVTIRLEQDHLSIGHVLVPLGNLKDVTVFKVKQISFPKNSAGSCSRWTRFTRYITALMAAENIPFLSIEFADNKGETLNGLFSGGQYLYLREFARSINEKAGLPMEGQVIT